MRRVFCILCVCLSLLLAACTAAPSPDEFQTAAEKTLPPIAGVWYASRADPWEKEYLGDELEKRFFGDMDTEGVCYRLFLGTDDAQMAEILIATLETESDAVLLAEYLAARLSGLRERAGDAFSASLSDAAVYRKGKTVLYTATPYNSEIVALFK